MRANILEKCQMEFSLEKINKFGLKKNPIAMIEPIATSAALLH